ncbi:MAG: acyl-CoA thioesterase [Bacteroidota bacterium]
MINSIEIQIRFSDIDLMGHVNNAIYLNYFESARMQCLVSLLGKWDWYGNGIILKTNELEYISPVFLEDKATVKVSVEHLGQKSFTLGYALYVNGELKTKGRSVLVSYNFKENRTQELHPAFRSALETLQANA